MLINTKHIVMFDEAANDFNRIAGMVDDDGAVLIIRNGKPAYAVVPFSEVQEGDAASTKPAPAAEPASEESRCACGGHAKSQCGGHGHSHDHGHPHAHARTHFSGRSEHFGHGSDAGHIHVDHTAQTEPQETGEWDFDFHAGPGFDPLFTGGPNFSVEDFIGKVPPNVMEAGQQILGRFVDLFGAATTQTPPPNPDKE